MRLSLWTSVSSLVVLIPLAAFADPKSDAVDTKYTFGAPLTYHNMTLVPVTTAEAGPFERFTLLEAGLTKKTLRVREIAGNSNEAQVNAVQIKNTGKLAAFILSGEMILGGKQDRIMANDTVVPSDGKWHKVEVFCVEQGRWRGRKMQFERGSALAHGQLRKAAISGRQSAVWDEVSRKNTAHGTNNPTQTYRRTVQNRQLRERVSRFRQELVRQLPDAQLSGFVFAINGETRVADLFSNPLLFSDLQDKLLSAYILEALEHQVNPRAKKIKKGDAAKFYKDAKKAKSYESRVSGRSKNLKKRSKRVVGTETVDNKSGRTLKESYLAQ